MRRDTAAWTAAPPARDLICFVFFNGLNLLHFLQYFHHPDRKKISSKRQVLSFLRSNTKRQPQNPDSPGLLSANAKCRSRQVQSGRVAAIALLLRVGVTALHGRLQRLCPGLTATRNLTAQSLPSRMKSCSAPPPSPNGVEAALRRFWVQKSSRARVWQAVQQGHS